MLYDKRWDDQKVDSNPKLAEWQKILLKAAALLRRNGWCRGQFQESNGSLCAYGAINVAAGLEARKKKYQPVEVIEAIQHLERSLGGTTIIQWNDNFARNQVEVIDALRKAAADERPLRVTIFRHGTCSCTVDLIQP